MINRKAIQELKDKLDMVFQVYLRTEEKLQEEMDQIPWEKISDGDVLNADKHLQYILANIARPPFLTATCSWLEVVMDVIGETLPEDYMNEVKHTDTGKKEENSWFDKRVLVFRNCCSAFTDMTEHRQFIKHVLRVRNCIVHDGGRVEKAAYPDQVGEAVEWLSNKAKESNVSYASITDGLIYLGSDIVGEMVIVSEDIIDHLWDHAGEN